MHIALVNDRLGRFYYLDVAYAITYNVTRFSFISRGLQRDS